MTGEYATIVLHLIPGGIYAECEDTDAGVMINKGDGNSIMQFINDVEDACDPDATFELTEKGLAMAADKFEDQ